MVFIEYVLSYGVTICKGKYYFIYFLNYFKETFIGIFHFLFELHANKVLNISLLHRIYLRKVDIQLP